MEELKQQEMVFKNIQSLCTNYRKDSITRKNTDYLTKKLVSIETQWQDFADRNNTLLQLEDKDIPYFMDNVYGRLREIYESTKMDILKLMSASYLPAEPASQPETTQQLRQQQQQPNEYLNPIDVKLLQLLRSQETNFKAFERTLSKIDLNKIKDKWELEDFMSRIKTKWDIIERTHWEIDSQREDIDETYEWKYSDLESSYEDMRRELGKKLFENIHVQQSAPRIEIPEFSGNYIDWISFKDVFTECIHNNPQIPKGLKMQHLKSKLRGEAEKIVQHLNISADNYDACWDILTHRFNNRRLLCTSFINTMLNLPIIQQPTANHIKKLLDTIIECLSGLQNIDISITSWDPIIVHLMSQKLDTATFNEYTANLKNPREPPGLEEFTNFLENKFMTLEAQRKPLKNELTDPKPSTSFRNLPYNKPKNIYKQETTNTFHTTSSRNCPLCKNSHVLMNCQRFLNLDTKSRNDTVTRLDLCPNCLYSHNDMQCFSSKKCKVCNGNHHTLLHSENANASNNQNTRSYSVQRASDENEEILLTTALLKVKSADGSYITLRALLDQGSQVSLISENAAQLLKLPKSKTSVFINGVGAASGNCKWIVKLECNSIHSKYSFTTEAWVMKNPVGDLPNSTFKPTTWTHLQNLKLADPEYNVSRTIDLLLGADIYSYILMEGVLKGELTAPVAQQTQLGWILCGNIKTLNCHVTLIDTTSMANFRKIENIASTTTIPEDEACEISYKNTTKRREDGRHLVPMPLKPEIEKQHGNSKTRAIAHFPLEKRLNRQAILAIMYKEFLHEYQLGHMKSAPLNSTYNVSRSFLPHSSVTYSEVQQQLIKLLKGGGFNLRKWDATLPANILTQWSKLTSDLHKLKEINLQRWIASINNDIELRGFCDASEKAYSCVVYSRNNEMSTQEQFNIIAAKTRVDSRGILPSQLLTHKLWWKGPNWLQTFEGKTELRTYTTELEQRKQTFVTQRVPPEEHFIDILLKKHSSLARLQRIVAWVKRFCDKMYKKKSGDCTYLTTNELNEAMRSIVRRVQLTHFADELEKITQHKSIFSSTIHKLNSYLDSEGLLRVGGRLKNSQLNYNMKQPIILPHSGLLTKLIINHAHITTRHGGARLTLATIRLTLDTMKHHLRRVLGEQKLTYEQLSTLLAGIEACMNSRPLCSLTEDPEEFSHYLTPGHFLTGSSILAPPQSDYDVNGAVDLRNRWQITERMQQQIWKTWSQDYLTLLQTRSKWQKPRKNIEKGDIVLIKEANLPPGKWAMGRVVELHPGDDGYVRVATVKTKNGLLKRPVIKLAPLPMSKNSTTTPSEKEPENLHKHSTKKLDKCIVKKHDLFICSANKPIYELHNKNAPCQAKFLSHQPTLPCQLVPGTCEKQLIQLHARNSWLGICCDTYFLLLICEDRITTYTIHETSVIKLRVQSNCLLQENDAIIHSHTWLRPPKIVH